AGTLSDTKEARLSGQLQLACDLLWSADAGCRQFCRHSIHCGQVSVPAGTGQAPRTNEGRRRNLSTVRLDDLGMAQFDIARSESAEAALSGRNARLRRQLRLCGSVFYGGEQAFS